MRAEHHLWCYHVHFPARPFSSSTACEWTPQSMCPTYLLNFGTRFMLWHRFCVIVIYHKNPFLECWSALGLLSNPFLGTVTLFLKPCSGSMPFLQNDLVASLPGIVLIYVLWYSITALHLLYFPKVSVSDGGERHKITLTLLLQPWTYLSHNESCVPLFNFDLWIPLGAKFLYDRFPKKHP